MKRTWYEIIFGLIKKIFVGLLIGTVNASNYTKCVLLINQKCMTQPTFNKLHPNEHSQKFHCRTFVVILDRCVGSCNTLNDLSNKACVQNETEELNLSRFNMITGIHGSKALKTNVNIDLMKGNVTQINGGITINVDVSVRNVMYVKKIMFEILLHVAVKMENI